MIRLNGLTKHFQQAGRTFHALGPIDLQIAEGEFLTVLGPSGCGKTTLLHVLGGFEAPSTGSVEVAGARVTGPGRDRGMVFQEATLLPWKTAMANVAWPLEVAGVSRSASLDRARELLQRVGLSGFEEAYPAELSGGMRQRAALARTLALEPKVLLMDEPFGALDAQTRELMQEELTRLWQSSGLTVVFVTHDIHEAIFLGDRVIVLGKAPGSVIEDCRIELPRPRSAETKSDPKVLSYRAHLWQLIRSAAPAMR
jgi:NitT/TauT family transport system ATP-binding protein